MAATVLVVEDEARLRDLIRTFLDLGPADVPGLEVSKELRRGSGVPLLVVTAEVSAEGPARLVRGPGAREHEDLSCYWSTTEPSTPSLVSTRRAR